MFFAPLFLPNLRPHHRLPRIPLNLFFPPTGPASALDDEGLTATGERSVPIPLALPSNRSQGATSALRGVGPALPPIARRDVGGKGQSMLDLVLGAVLGAVFGAREGAMLAGRLACALAALWVE